MGVRVLKRALDLAIALPALVVLSPVIALTALAVRLKLGSPVLFRQERPGLHAEPFTLHKFRSMSDARGPDGELLPDAERLGRFGRFLRASSLDELPELVDVVRGTMSLVGPRPLLLQYVAQYTPEQARRMDVTPGITGLAQVSGRNAVTWEERFALDVQYVDSWSIGLDLRILVRSLAVVLRREGVTQEGSATAEVWTGSSR
jgi:lipopolysaccharide/colanic/teichoic acid biosynthesis glycosyltransferase